MSSCLPSVSEGVAFSRSRLKINKQRNSYARLEHTLCLGCATESTDAARPSVWVDTSLSLQREIDTGERKAKRGTAGKREFTTHENQAEKNKKSQISEERVHFSACKNCTYLYIVAIAIKYCLLCLKLCTTGRCREVGIRSRHEK